MSSDGERESSSTLLKGLSMREFIIPLTQGLKTRVSDTKRGREALGFKWCAQRAGRRFYAVRYVYKNRVKKQIRLHRFLTRAVLGSDVDHIDGDGLNNTDSNLRIVTRQENLHAFRRKSAGRTSRFIGVCWNKKKGKWQAGLQHNYKQIHIGLFRTETGAALAYKFFKRGLSLREKIGTVLRP